MCRSPKKIKIFSIKVLTNKPKEQKQLKNQIARQKKEIEKLKKRLAREEEYLAELEAEVKKIKNFFKKTLDKRNRPCYNNDRKKKER
jgi:septal ring factor EnvC (AmiA/AmiB activator)